MAEFQMVAKDLERLCSTYRSLGKCGTDECPLYCEDLCCVQIMVHVHGDEAGRLEDAVMAWAEENPEPVYPTWYRWLVMMGAVGSVEDLFSDLQHPIPADIAEKLGIESKEG